MTVAEAEERLWLEEQATAEVMVGGYGEAASQHVLRCRSRRREKKKKSEEEVERQGKGNGRRRGSSWAAEQSLRPAGHMNGVRGVQ